MILRFTILVLIGLATLVNGPEAHAAEPATTEAPVVVWNRTITILRAPHGRFSSVDRARGAEDKIRAIPEGERSYQVKVQDATVDKLSGAWIVVNDEPVFGVLREDAASALGESFETYKENILVALNGWLAARAEQRRWPLFVHGVALSLLATLLWGMALFLVVRLRRRWLVRARTTEGKALLVGDVNLRPHLIALEAVLLRLAVWSVAFLLGYVWLTFVFNRFPYSRPWGLRLREFFLEIVGNFGRAIVNAIPNIFTVVLILAIARLLARAVHVFFRSAETGAIHTSWLEPETARTSRRLIVAMIWLFALVIAYPYIPGSDTPAFQGLSVLLGLMVSVGSTGLVGQVIGGLVLVYTRAFRCGDFVKLGDHEGTVLEMGMLSTKVLTMRGEEISIPNAVVIAASSVNYSRRVGAEGAVIATTVTIGYDVPWRQVHALLLEAAERTPEVRKAPAPRVLQRALADFSVEYMLLVNIEHPEDRYRALSALLAHIQDSFNERGVQIMSPAFESQPERPVVVPPSRWFTAPAPSDGGSKSSD